MKPLSIKIENFLGIERLNYEFKPGVHVMVGRNGAGKSSFLEAIFFALYGRGFRHGGNVKSYVRHGATSAKISFDFKRGDRTYRILRIIHKKKTSEAALYLLEDENHPRPIAIKTKDVNEEIIKIIGVPDSIFMRTFLIPQNEIDRLLTESRSFKELIMEFTGFRERKEELKDKLQNYKNEIEKKLEALGVKTIESLLKDIGEEESILKEIEEKEAILEKLTEKERKILNRLKEIETLYRYVKLRKELENLTMKRKKLIPLAETEALARRAKPFAPIYSQLKNLEENLKENLQKKEKLQKELLKISEERSKLESEIKAIERESEEKESKLEELSREEEKLNNILKKSSPILQELMGKRKILDEVKHHLTENENEGKEIRKKIEDMKGREEKLTQETRELGLKIKELEKSEMSWLAWRISAFLNDGDTCPVCGNIYRRGIERKKTDFDEQLYESLKNRSDEIQKLLSEISGQRRGLEERREKLALQWRELKKREKGLLKDINILEEKLKLMGYTAEISEKHEKVRETLKDLAKNLENLKKLHQDRRIQLEKNKESASSINKRLKELKEETEKLSEEREKLKKELEEGLKELGLNEEEFKKLLHFEEKGYVEELQKIEGEISSIEKLLQNITFDLEEIEKEKNKLEETLSKVREELDKEKLERGKLLKALEDIQKLRAELEEKKKQAEEIEEELDVVKELELLFRADRFDQFFFKSRVDTILNLANSQLLQLTEGRFKLDIGNKDNLMVYREGAPLPVQSLSGGEKALISIVLSMAISEMFIGNMEAFFIDEGFANLDEINREKVAEILRGFETHGRVIIFITHHEDLASRFQNVIKMENGRLVSFVAG